jgi:hypothetical protein
LDRNRLLAILAFFVLLLPSVCVFYQARDIPQFGVIEDDGLYFTAAKSLAEQGEYRMLSIPGQPYQTKYPPLYPLLLSLVWRANPVFPGNLVLASLVSWLCWLLFLGSAFVFLGQCGLTTTGRWTAWVLLAASSRLILISSDLLSEALFSALILNALLLNQNFRHSSFGHNTARLPTAKAICPRALLFLCGSSVCRRMDDLVWCASNGPLGPD